jgi:hypothetical protein
VSTPPSNGLATVSYLFPIRGGSSSPCLLLMRTRIEQNGCGLAGAQLCRRARGSSPVSFFSLSLSLCPLSFRFGVSVRWGIRDELTEEIYCLNQL